MGIVANSLENEKRNAKASAYDKLVQGQKDSEIASAGHKAGSRDAYNRFQAELMMPSMEQGLGGYVGGFEPVEDIIGGGLGDELNYGRGV